jgi:predicted SAM-dependent methyltransferase
MKKFHNLLIKIKSYIKTFFYLIQKEKKIDNLEVKLNLGCGNEYKDGWVNIDVDKSVRTDICCDFMNLKKYFKPNSVDLIYMIHSISYLNLWESLIFF